MTLLILKDDILEIPNGITKSKNTMLVHAINGQDFNLIKKLNHLKHYKTVFDVKNNETVYKTYIVKDIDLIFEPYDKKAMTYIFFECLDRKVIMEKIIKEKL